jgi:signal transduction histidine kinase
MPEQPANAYKACLKSRLTVAGLALCMLLAGPGRAVGQAVPSAGSPTSPLPHPAPAGPGVTRRVLLLYSEPRLTPAIVAVDSVIRSTLEARLPGPVSFYTEYLDLNLFDGDIPQPELRALLRRKYASRPIDLIMAGGSRSLRVALHNRKDLFSSAPVVFVAVDPRVAADLRLDADVTGTWLHMGWTETIDLARRLQPDTRRAVVVGGVSPADRVWLDQARQQLATRAGSVEISYLADLALEDVLKAVTALPTETVVLVGVFVRDAAGRDFVTPEVVKRIVALSTVPTYGLTDNAVGAGAVGGYVVSYEAHGQAAAELALRILVGERPPPTEAGTNVPMVDARQLQRWRLDARRLPAGSVVRFREPSLWEQYRWYVVGAASALLVQSGLIGGLLVQRAQRRRAQARLAESMTQIQTLAGRLITAQEEERRRIARELHDDVGQRVASLAIGLSGLKRRLPDAEGAVRDELSQLQQQTLSLSKDLRNLSHELHPGALEHVGLIEALRGRCDAVSAEPGIPVRLDVDDGWADVSDDVARCLYRVAQEGLRNIVKHAHATRAQLSLARRDGQVVMRIHDDGRGFEPGAASERRGLGLVSMGERVRMLGGQLEVQASPNAGTILVVTLPAGDRP